MFFAAIRIIRLYAVHSELSFIKSRNHPYSYLQRQLLKYTRYLLRSLNQYQFPAWDSWSWFKVFALIPLCVVPTSLFLLRIKVDILSVNQRCQPDFNPKSGKILLNKTVIQLKRHILAYTMIEKHYKHHRSHTTYILIYLFQSIKCNSLTFVCVVMCNTLQQANLL